MESYYTKFVSFEAADALTKVGYTRCMIGEAIDWFINNDIYIDLSLETMTEPSWSWTISFMGDKWKKVHDKKGGVMGCLDGSVDSFDECANSAIIAACNMLTKYKEI